MTKISLLTEERKAFLSHKIIDYFATELDQEIGLIAAESLLEFFIETAGNDIYNQGLQEATDFIENSFQQSKIDLEVSLKK